MNVPGITFVCQSSKVDDFPRPNLDHGLILVNDSAVVLIAKSVEFCQRNSSSVDEKEA